MASDREKLAMRMAQAEDGDLKMIVEGSGRAAERAEAARELARRGLPVPEHAIAIDALEPAREPSAPAATRAPSRGGAVVYEDAPAPVDPVGRFRAVVIGAKLGMIASVFSVFVLPSSIGAWPIVITGGLIGGGLALFLTQRRG